MTVRTLTATAVLFATAAAASAAPTNMRGTVAAVDGTTVTVKTQDRTVKLTLDEHWKIAGVAKASMADIKPGTFIGTANVQDASGNKALEVVVFPEALRGTGEGDYGWDLKPGSKMTNATVTSQVNGVDGQTVSLAYKGGEKKVTIAPSVPVVTVVPADKADVKPGAAVFLSGEPEGDSMLSGGRLVVGKDGVVPPM